MADNYLEKKMEEHRRAAVAKSATRRIAPTGERAGTISFKIDPLRVLVTDGMSGHSAAVISRLREAGCKVAFAGTDDKGGRALAQKSGARFYPASFAGNIAADLEKTWGGLDAVVVTDGKMPDGVKVGGLRRVVVIGNSPELPEIESSDGLTVNGVNICGRSASDVAHLCVVLCLNASDCINMKLI